MVGIYKITNTKNNKVYIGQSVDIKQRFNQHKRDLRGNNHVNCWLQDDWNIYGEDAFSFEVVHKCRSVYLNQAEKYYIDEHNATKREHGYNIHPGVGRDYREPRWRRRNGLPIKKGLRYEKTYTTQVDMAFFRNQERKIEYNALCMECERDCKQSHKAMIMICPAMVRKR